jgi:hypothetical protein
VRQSSLRPEFVEYIPETPVEGTIYISRRYRTASHLCCCSCGLEVVTPLNQAKWRLIEHPDGKVSLMPSIGNWSFPCQSHYFLKKNRVEWAPAFSPELIASIQAGDRNDAAMLGRSSLSHWARFAETARGIWADISSAIKRALSR